MPEITPAQANALMVIVEQRDPITARQLAGRLSVSEVTAGRFVEALEKGGWVERLRDPRDARAVLIRPTRPTRRWLPRFTKVAYAVMDQASRGLNRDEVIELSETMGRVLGNLAPE